MYIPDDDFKGDDNNNSDDSDDDSDKVKSGQSSHCPPTSWEAFPSMGTPVEGITIRIKPNLVSNQRKRHKKK